MTHGLIISKQKLVKQNRIESEMFSGWYPCLAVPGISLNNRDQSNIYPRWDLLSEQWINHLHF